jgi:hypothetical protein
LCTSIISISVPNGTFLVILRGMAPPQEAAPTAAPLPGGRIQCISFRTSSDFDPGSSWTPRGSARPTVVGEYNRIRSVREASCLMGQYNRGFRRPWRISIRSKDARDRIKSKLVIFVDCGLSYAHDFVSFGVAAAPNCFLSSFSCDALLLLLARELD